MPEKGPKSPVIRYGRTRLVAMALRMAVRARRQNFWPDKDLKEEQDDGTSEALGTIP